MAYNTGSRDDWDYVSRIAEDPAWTWDAMAHHRDLNQKYVAPNDGHDDVSRNHSYFALSHSYHSFQTNQYLPSAHSRDGMVSISLAGYPKSIDSKITAAIAEPAFASEFPFQRDMNTGNTVRFTMATLSGLYLLICPCFWKQIGVGWVQCSIGNGQRSSSATSYVGPGYINRQNLHILLHAHATKLLEATDLDTMTPHFNGVEFGTGPSSKSISPIARVISFIGHKVKGGR